MNNFKKYLIDDMQLVLRVIQALQTPITPMLPAVMVIIVFAIEQKLIL